MKFSNTIQEDRALATHRPYGQLAPNQLEAVANLRRQPNDFHARLRPRRHLPRLMPLEIVYPRTSRPPLLS